MTGAVLANASRVHPQRQVSPILRIPCEITSEIFQHCMPEDEFPPPTVISAPVLLSRVCSGWRKMAIGTPRLWSKILLSSTHNFEDTDASFPTNMEFQAVALEVWMKRATSLQLSVHLHYPTLPALPISELQFDKLPPVFRVIVGNAGRWKDLRLSLPRKYVPYAWNLTQQSGSNLESFDINDTSIPTSGPAANGAIPVFLRADTAETLTALSVRALLFYASSKPLPFVRLRILFLTYSYPDGCLTLLKYCPVLEDLTLHFNDLRDELTPADQPILLSQLRTFHLSHTANGDDEDRDFVAGCEIGMLLDSLELPNLKGFYLWMTIAGYDIYEDPEIPWDYLCRLITRSNCALTELELRASYMDTASIVKCVQLSPDLKYVGIPRGEELEDEVRRLLPSLQSLRTFEELAQRVISQRFTFNFTF
ncbi:hypothetical protein BD410DRAFT_796544 [Rickenella mellea]|uniref:Uncharacterized protein n=1 Tax=Rickenella mellea TaxID=50990 RepID=A0A4Y7PK93_9AGAM|nr:hypothetical protein BD410DRAFT_796544 [Rickenella mellea]